MTQTRKLNETDGQAVAGLAAASASDIKRLGWRKILDRARQNNGRLTVTNHDQVQAVVLTLETYEELLARGQKQPGADEQALAELRARFDERLASLEAPGAAAALRKAIDNNRLHGKVKAGETC